MPSWGPTRLPKSTKIEEKTMPRGAPSWASIFNQFFTYFSLILRSSESLERPSGTTKIVFLSLSRFLTQNKKVVKKTFQKPAFCLPQSFKNRVQDGFKTASKSTTILYSILMRFGLPKWCHVGPMLTPKTARKSLKNRCRERGRKKDEKSEKKPEKSAGVKAPQTKQPS